LAIIFTALIVNFMDHNFKNLITEHNISQSEIAKILKISRPTVAKILAGTKEIRMSEAERLAEILGISVGEIFGNKDPIEVILEKAPLAEKQEMRISVPAQNIEKFKNALLYITQSIGALPNVGETVLYKILYFCDFDYYEKYEEQLIGATYIRNHYGPTPCEFSTIVAEMIKDGQIEKIKSKFFNKDQAKYIPVIEPDLSIFTGRELQHIEQEVAKLGRKTAKELSDLSHKDVPWIVTKMGDKISYETVFYRTQETSVRVYENN